MKKTKKFLIPIILLTVFIFIALLISKNNNTHTHPSNTATTNTSNSNIINDENRANFKGENAVIYLGTHSQYEPFSIILNKSLSQEALSKEIIFKISELIGYKIEINSLTIKEKDIYIDLSSNAAPFNIEESYIESDKKLYSIYGSENLVYTIFNSIYKSLTSYLGSDYNIYFSNNSENINISIENFEFYIDCSIPYKLDE